MWNILFNLNFSLCCFNGKIAVCNRPLWHRAKLVLWNIRLLSYMLLNYLLELYCISLINWQFVWISLMLWKGTMALFLHSSDNFLQVKFLLYILVNQSVQVVFDGSDRTNFGTFFWCIKNFLIDWNLMKSWTSSVQLNLFASDFNLMLNFLRVPRGSNRCLQNL